jgi:hypothetical protein
MVDTKKIDTTSHKTKRAVIEWTLVYGPDLRANKDPDRTPSIIRDADTGFLSKNISATLLVQRYR